MQTSYHNNFNFLVLSSDFRWLRDRLQTEMPGGIVPIIPHRRTIMSNIKFNIEFIEQRRLDLEEFLNEIAVHGELCRAPSMTPFMLDPLGPDFDEGKKRVESATPTQNKWAGEDTQSEISGPTGIMTNKSSQSTPMTARLGNFFAKLRLSAGNQELMTTKDESQVVALNEYVTEVQSYTNGLIKASEAILKSTSSAADAYHEIGIPIGMWRTVYMQQILKQDESTREMMAGICELSDSLSSLLRNKHKKEEFLFGRKIHKLANTVSAFDIALKQRKSCQMEFTHIHNNMIEKNQALEKAQKNLKPPEVTEQLQRERVELESLIEFGRQELDEITKRLLRDAETNRPKLLLMLQSAFLAFAKVQISYTSQLDEACKRLLPNLEEAADNPIQAPSTKSPTTDVNTCMGVVSHAPAPATAPPAPPPPIPDAEDSQ